MEATGKHPILLDGGLSNQLESQGSNLHPTLWTAELLKSDPEAIVNAHLAYLEAGAQCIITASYQATIPGFKCLDIGEDEGKALITKSVELADEAVDRFLNAHPQARRPLIAASVGPYGAYLADGSEYKGNYGVPDEHLHYFHLSRIRLLGASRADFLACETLPSFQEAKVLADLLSKMQKQAWVTFSCRNARFIHDGTSIEQCVELLNDHPNVFAIGVNCTAPNYISELIKTIKPLVKDKKVVVYPNSGEQYHKDSSTWSMGSGPVFGPQLVQEWVDLGVDMVGGCCRVGPAEIKEVAKWIRNNK